MVNCTKTVRTMGVDLSDKSAHFCLLGANGDEERHGKIRLTEKGVRSLLEGEQRLRVIVEAGTHSPWVSRLVQELGHEVVVANPRQLPMIYQNHKKTDRVDAEQLARIGRLDPKLLAPIQHRGSSAQAHLALLRGRLCGA